MVDVLIVGAGLYGATLARLLTDAGKKVLVIDRRDHIAGNAFTRPVAGILTHVYGAHIFHTNNQAVWDFVGRFAAFNRFTNAPLANYRGALFSLPFSMYTFYQLWGTRTPEEARRKILEQRQAGRKAEPANLEEQAIALVGPEIYEKLIKGYTQKQWGRPCSELPAFIIRRLPVRFTYDNNYFDALYQGIPIGGYTRMVENMLAGVEVRLNTDYLRCRESLDQQAKLVVFTGPIDAFYGYRFGPLAYRAVRFETETLPCPNFQGNAVVNYTDEETPWTRIIEHKWFTFGRDEQGRELEGTVISREYSAAWSPGEEPFYPVNDEQNNALYRAYRALADRETRVRFGGRLGAYRYYDMDQVIAAAMAEAEQLIGAFGLS